MLSDSDFGSVSGSIRTPAAGLKKFTDSIESYLNLIIVKRYWDQNLRRCHLLIVPLKNYYEYNVIAGQGYFTAAGMLGIDDHTTVYTYYMSSRETVKQLPRGMERSRG